MHSLHFSDFSLLHLLILKDVKLLCVNICLFRTPVWMEAKLHWMHLCGFSPVWVSLCVASRLALKHDLRHMLQGCLLAMMKIFHDSPAQCVDINWENSSITKWDPLSTFSFLQTNHSFFNEELSKWIHMQCLFETEFDWFPLSQC